MQTETMSRGAKRINHSDSNLADGVLSGTAWSGGSVTYGFPSFKGVYKYNGEPDHKFHEISGKQQKAAMFALDVAFGGKANDGFSVEGFTNLSISQVNPRKADINIGQSADANPTAYTYYPSGSARGGDIWFGSKHDYRSPEPGNYEWHTMLHELGHSLGLKHGHLSEGGFAALPGKYDSLEYSVMTYRTHIHGATNGYGFGNGSAPQTYMMADIAALQFMYGADFSTNGDDTTYQWRPGHGKTIVNGNVALAPVNNHIFGTIWDGDGIDTYDLHAYRSNLKIDLAPGGYSVFKSSQLADLGGGPNNGHARGNIFNALLYDNDKRSLIENAIGGRGNDDISGNSAANRLVGKGGRDVLDGGKGDDILIGNGAADKFVFSDKYGTDQINDFQDTVDKLVFKGLGLKDKADTLSHASQIGDDVHFDFGGGDILIVLHIDISKLTSADIVLG